MDHFINLDFSGSTNETNKRLRMASMAMRMPSDLGSSGLGSVQRRFTNESETNCSLKNWKNEKKKAVLISVKLVKRKIQLVIN